MWADSQGYIGHFRSGLFYMDTILIQIYRAFCGPDQESNSLVKRVAAGCCKLVLLT